MKKLYFIAFLFILKFGYSQNSSDRDLNFNPFSLPLNHYFVDTTVKKSVITSDGKILLIHSTPTGDKLIRMDGNLLDTSFTIGNTLLGSTSSGLIQDLLLQPDGKILVSGNFQQYNGITKRNIVRINADGALDTSFTSGAPTYVNEGAIKLALQSDGKIFVLGASTTYGNMVRLNSNGSLDATFTAPANYRIQTFTMLPDGKLLVGHGSINDAYLLNKVSRLNSNGTFDTSFPTALFTGFNNDPNLYKIFLQSDGKILIGGQFTGCNSISRRDLVRLNADGTMDASFTIGAGFTEDSGFNLDEIFDIVEQPDHKILASGTFTKFNGIARYDLIRLNQDGSLDTAYTNGYDFLNFTTINSISLFNDGKILASGSYGDYRKEVGGVVKINTDGTRDSSFNNIDKGFFNVPVKTLQFTTNGKILVGGNFHLYNGEKCYGFTRLNDDGSRDTTLNYGGQNGFEYSSNDLVNITAIVPLASGKTYIGGSFKYYNGQTLSTTNGVIRINADGTRDTTFNMVGNYDGNIMSILPRQDGSILVGGNFTVFNGNTVNALTLITATGNYWTSFNLGNYTYGACLKNQSDGKILVATGTGIKRYSQDMFVDTSLILDPSLTSITLNSCEIQPDGKILIGGKFTINGVVCSLARLLNNGTLDSTFNFSMQNSTIVVDYFAMMPDQKVMVNYKNQTTLESRLIRLNNNGSIDSSFTEQTNLSCAVSASPTGQVYLHGNIKSYQGQSARGLIRLMAENYYFINGQNKIDMNNNGCDNNDIIYPNLKVQIASTSSNFYFFANTSGDYQIGTEAGNYTITPAFENPSYFTVSPNSLSVNFPSQASPMTQNFCIAPNGVHNDLEITILPINTARPGFDAKYKLIYKNKGNQLQSGTINFTFEDALIDFVIALPGTSTQSSSSLNWDFTNLKPFESREIVVTLNLNSPIETPPLNSGNVLYYTAAIAPDVNDDRPDDNLFRFSQTVVNSLDPNDKICLEGAAITTVDVGNYVHYIIHFENSGTFAAKDITVKDSIDTNKYDINTLIPLTGSHSFITKVYDTNKVDFFFEDINLPFNDVTNDGYVAFKIKTKSNLVAGDSFSNSAAIYFDYNAAIYTNTATTLVLEPLHNQDFVLDHYITVYPNPVADHLSIAKKNAIEITAISIYNTLGQLVLVIPNARNTETIDVSTLKTGNYFMKINSDKGTTNTKFIKL